MYTIADFGREVINPAMVRLAWEVAKDAYPIYDSGLAEIGRDNTEASGEAVKQYVYGAAMFFGEYLNDEI